MIEVFKTDVSNLNDAVNLISKIERSFPGYHANFDLQDCDRILRIISVNEIESTEVINFIKKSGFQADILPEEIFSTEEALQS